jgi:hypothetical protein
VAAEGDHRLVPQHQLGLAAHDVEQVVPGLGCGVRAGQLRRCGDVGCLRQSSSSTCVRATARAWTTRTAGRHSGARIAQARAPRRARKAATFTRLAQEVLQ